MPERMKMLPHLPFEIQVEILKWLPVKSLIQFRSVSKAWRSLIDSSKFIADHSLRHTQRERLLIRYTEESESRDVKYVSYVDDDTFPHQKSVLTVPHLFEYLEYPFIVGSSHGLLCSYGYFKDPDNPSSEIGTAVLWNPSIRKNTAIFMPDLYNPDHHIVLGFGVCPVISETKIVMIKRLSIYSEEEETVDWEIKVYTLNSRKWRSLSSNLPWNSILVQRSSSVVIGRFIYWLALITPFTDEYRRLILSFDITDEIFRVIDFPDSMPQPIMSISKLRGSLTVIDDGTYLNNGNRSCGVWMMGDDGVQKSFTKLFTIETPYDLRYALGLRKSGQPLLEILDDIDDDQFVGPPTLVCYEPNSKHFTDLEICAAIKFQTFDVKSYVETLLLLGQPGCYSY